MATSAWRTAFAATLVLTTVLFMAPVQPVAGTPGGVPVDKVAHVVVLGVLAFLAARAWPDERRVLLWVALVAYGAAVEAGQALLPWRSAEALDLAADAVGASVAFLTRPSPGR